MCNEIDLCIDIIKKMIVENKPVTIISENYVTFNNIITNFVFKNGLDDTVEWKNISDSMIYTSNQSFTTYAADNVLYNLESLKRLYLKNVHEESEFDKHIHPIISSVCKKKYLDGFYADAVESAFKEINT